jgi:hypothetical protein
MWCGAVWSVVEFDAFLCMKTADPRRIRTELTL